MKPQRPSGPQPKDLLVFHKVARALTSELNLDSILRAIMRQMEQYFEPEQWSLLIMDEVRQELYYAVVVGYTGADLDDARVKLGHGLAGWVAQRGETLIIPDADDHPRLEEPGTGRHFRIRSAICMPLIFRQRVLGVLQVFNCHMETLGDDTVAFLHLLCDYAAIAIENARAVQRIEELTITDDCTGLFNQRQLYRMLEKEREHARGAGTRFSLIFIDLDHFKRVNDEHGHLVGSRLLAEFGRAISCQVRACDAVFRYGAMSSSCCCMRRAGKRRSGWPATFTRRCAGMPSARRMGWRCRFARAMGWRHGPTMLRRFTS